jgi:hypothetical protein
MYHHFELDVRGLTDEEAEELLDALREQAHHFAWEPDIACVMVPMQEDLVTIVMEISDEPKAA